MIVGNNLRFSKLSLPNFPLGGVIGTAVTTIDISSFIEINQITANQTLTLPNPTTTDTALKVTISNIGTVSFTMYGVIVSTGQVIDLYYTNSSWKSVATVDIEDWTLSGNSNTNPSLHFIGTIDNQSIALRTNNTERLRVLNSGEVGVGTLTPGVKFVVQDSSGNIARFGWNATDYIQLVSGGVESRLESTLNRPFRFRTNGVDRLSILGTGEIGLNTLTPTSSVQMNGSVSETTTVISATTTLNNTFNKVILNNGATNITITLPDALTCIGRKYVFSRYAGSTGIVTLQGSGTNQIQAFAGTVGATTTIGIHSAAGAGLSHSFTAVNIGGVGVWVRI